MSVYFAEHDVVLHAGDALGGPGGCEAGHRAARQAPRAGAERPRLELSVGSVTTRCYGGTLRGCGGARGVVADG